MSAIEKGGAWSHIGKLIASPLKSEETADESTETDVCAGCIYAAYFIVTG